MHEQSIEPRISRIDPDGKNEFVLLIRVIRAIRGFNLGILGGLAVQSSSLPEELAEPTNPPRIFSLRAGDS
jgi:hypothetical protein